MQTTINSIGFVVTTTDDLLQALDTWLQTPAGVGLQLYIRGVTLDFPHGLTKRQFLSLVDYAYELVGEHGVH